MDKSLDRYHLPEANQNQTYKLYRPITPKKIVTNQTDFCRRE